MERKIMDRLVRFCLPMDLQEWLNNHKAPACESAFAKDIPNTSYNHFMANKLSKIFPIRRKYRGKSTETYRRPQSYILREKADRFALYERI